MHRAELTYEEYEPIDGLLVTQRYVNGTVGTLDARRWIGPTGLEFYQTCRTKFLKPEDQTFMVQYEPNSFKLSAIKSIRSLYKR
jgi:hypothetical protein